MNLGRYRKGIAATAGAVLTVLGQVVVPEEWQPWTALATAIATVILVVAGPANDPKPPKPAP